jgi:hypothetical protein
MASWDETNLLRRVTEALAFAERAISTLGSDGYFDADDPAVSVRREKVVGETALLLLAGARISDRAGVRPYIDRLAAQLIPLARSERIKMAMCLQPSLAHDFAFAHGCLTRLGFADSGFDDVLTDCLRAEEALCRESLPHHIIEQNWIRAIWNIPAAPPARKRAALTNSILADNVDVLFGTREDLYAFTHALLFATDLGAQRRRMPRGIVTATAAAEAALAHCIDADDFDLAGELLLVWPILRQPWSAAARFSFQVLARVEDEVGFLPAPIVRAERYWSLEGEKQKKYGLAAAYHTAYVMGLLCAVILATGHCPPRVIPRRRARAGAAVAIAHGGEPTRQWQLDFAQLSPRQQDALAPWLLTMAIQRAARETDFARIQQLLEIGVRYGIVAGPAPRQAAHLLRRAANVVGGRQTDEPQAAVKAL